MSRFNDGNIFSRSATGRKMMKKTLQHPLPGEIPTISEPTPHIFIKDETFLLLENLMKPYSKRYVTGNYEHKLSRA